MADERLTKRERREQSRRERKEREAAEARRARRNRILTAITSVAVIGGIVALVVLTRQPAAPTGITITRAAATTALQDAACEPVDVPVAQSFEHLSEPAPPPDELYPVRPTSNGRHFGTTWRIGAFDEPLDERFTTHNLEHGAVIVWYLPDELDESAVSALEDWARDRNRAGFDGDAGAGIIVAPWEESSFDTSSKAIAVRAWTVAMDCGQFDQTALDAFLIENFGTHGVAPEAAFAPYPEDVLAFEGEDGAATEEPADGGSPDATESPVDTGSPADTASPEGSPTG